MAKSGMFDDGRKKNRGKIKKKKETLRRALLKKVKKGGVCLEIGVWRGDFSETILEILEPKSLMLIDAWQEPEKTDHSVSLAALAGSSNLDRTYKEILAKFADQIETGQISVVRDFSFNAIKTLDDESIDFAYLDADHSYEGTSRDLDLLMPKIKIGGIIACDDYHRRGWWRNGVIRAVNEHIGRNAKTIRVFALEGAQVAFEKMAPMD